MTIDPRPSTGYDPGFLQVAVPLPAREVGPSRLVELGYVHFTVLLDPRRRLAASAVVNIDGAALVDVDRGDDWHLDDRVDPAEQSGPALYTANDLDRGHLVRRRDPVWGPREAAERANFDSFAYTNAAPQASVFNQSMELWLGLEDYVLDYAEANDLRLSVFTGPVFDDSDPLYRGVQIPRRFYKIAAWTSTAGAGAEQGPRLSATAYVLDQTPQLDDVDLATQRALRAGQVPPLGPYRTFLVPVGDVAQLTRLDLGPLPDADRLAGQRSDPQSSTPGPTAADAPAEPAWRVLSDATALIDTVRPT